MLQQHTATTAHALNWTFNNANKWAIVKMKVKTTISEEDIYPSLESQSDRKLIYTLRFRHENSCNIYLQCLLSSEHLQRATLQVRRTYSTNYCITDVLRSYKRGQSHIFTATSLLPLRHTCAVINRLLAVKEGGWVTHPKTRRTRIADNESEYSEQPAI